MSSDASLSRIPFQPADEKMIASMAVWMRFIGIFTIIGGFLILFVALLLIALFSTLQHFENTELRQFYA
jgi:fatty acid desaturase